MESPNKQKISVSNITGEYESLILNGSYETEDDGAQAGLLTVGDYKYLYGKIKGSEIPDHIYEKMLHGEAFTKNDERLVKYNRN